MRVVVIGGGPAGVSAALQAAELGAAVDLTTPLANAQRVSDYLYQRRLVAGHIRSAGIDLVQNAGDISFVDPIRFRGPRVSQAAQMVVNQLGIRPMRHLWGSLSLTPPLPD